MNIAGKRFANRTLKRLDRSPSSQAQLGGWAVKSDFASRHIGTLPTVTISPDYCSLGFASSGVAFRAIALGLSDDCLRNI